LLGYALDKAKESCKTNGEAISGHFVDVNKTISMPKGATNEVSDIFI